MSRRFGSTPARTAVNRLPSGSEGFADGTTRNRIRQRIARVRLGNFGDTRSVGEGVQELRIHFGPGYRVYLGREGEAIVILLCGGDKGAQERDIERAQVYWRDHRSRADE